MQIPSLIWNSGPTVYPCRATWEVTAVWIQSKCSLGIWRMTVCQGVIGVPGLLEQVTQSSYNQNESCVHILEQKVKQVLSGCWSVVSLVTDPVCGPHGQDFTAQPEGRECPVWETQNHASAFCRDVVLLALSDHNLQHVLVWSVKQLGWQSAHLRSQRTFWVGNESLPQVREFKYLGVLFSGGKMEWEIDRQIGAMSLHQTAVVERGVSLKAKLSIYLSVYVPTLTCGPELWVANITMRFKYKQPQWASFEGCSGSAWVQSRELHIEKSQLMWCGHLFRRLPGRLPSEDFQVLDWMSGKFFN